MTFEDAWLQDPTNTLSEDNSRKRDAKHYYDAGVRAERERCAQIAETIPNVDGYPVALAIRRGDA